MCLGPQPSAAQLRARLDELLAIHGEAAPAAELASLLDELTEGAEQTAANAAVAADEAHTASSAQGLSNTANRRPNGNPFMAWHVSKVADMGTEGQI
jgi:ATP phosphoribosyltransferase regulatory subunit HisZ